MTLTKTSKAAKNAIANASDIRCYSLSNNFIGKPLADKPVIWGGEVVNNQFTKLVEISQSEFLTRELASRGSKLTVSDNGRFCLHVHSNLWYDFTA